MKTLKPINLKKDQNIEITLIDGTIVKIATLGNNCTMVNVTHHSTPAIKEVTLEKFGYDMSEGGNHSWTACQSEFGSYADKNKVMVHHTAFNK